MSKMDWEKHNWHTIDNDFLQLNPRILWHTIFMTCIHNQLCKSLNDCNLTFKFNKMFDFNDRFYNSATKAEGQEEKE